MTAYIFVTINTKLHDLYSSLTIARVMKSRRERLAGNLPRMGEVCTQLWWENLRERDHWGDPGVDGRIILWWVFRKWDVEVWAGSEYSQVVGTCECGNELSGPIKCGVFFD
jgi:hypothetical protein